MLARLLEAAWCLGLDEKIDDVGMGHADRSSRATTLVSIAEVVRLSSNSRLSAAMI